MTFECDSLCVDFETDCQQEIIKCLMDTKFQVFQTTAYIIRRAQLDKGNFFNEYIDEGRTYEQIFINISRLRDDGTKDDKDQQQITEEMQAFYTGKPNGTRINRSDLIWYQGAIYDCRDLFTQEFGDNNDWIYQKFNIVFIQKSNDFPDSSYPTS